MKIYSHFSATGSKLKHCPFISELAMEGYLVENPEILNLSDDDDEIRIEENEKSWRKGENQGRIDLLAFYGDSTAAVIELKNGILDEPALEQLYEYFKDKKHLEYVANSFELSSKEGVQWQGVLVGTGIKDGLKTTIEKNNSSGEIPIAVMTLKRYKDEGEGRIYTITDTVISPKKDKKDHTKYAFDGGLYNKRRLVLAMIQTHVKKHFATIDPEEFKNRLNALRKDKPILMDYEEAVREDNTPNRNGNIDKYYFTTKPEDAIVLKDGKLAVLSWWTIHDLDIMKAIAKTLGCSFE